MGKLHHIQHSTTCIGPSYLPLIPSNQDLFAKSDDRIMSEKLPIQYAHRAGSEWVNDRSAFLPPALSQVTTLAGVEDGPGRLSASKARVITLPQSYYQTHCCLRGLIHRVLRHSV
jgi:hypothetical protein